MHTLTDNKIITCNKPALIDCAINAIKRLNDKILATFFHSFLYFNVATKSTALPSKSGCS